MGMFDHSQHAACIADKQRLTREIAVLNQRLDDQSRLVDELLDRMKEDRTRTEAFEKQNSTRLEVIDDDITEMEQRLVTRIEALEEPATTDSEKTKPSATVGYHRWTDRKKAKKASVTNPAALVARIIGSTKTE